MLKNISGTLNGPMKIMKTQGSLLDGVGTSHCAVLSVACCSAILRFIQFMSLRVNCHIVKCIFVHKTFIALEPMLHLEAEAFKVDRVSLVLLQRGSVRAVWY